MLGGVGPLKSRLCSNTEETYSDGSGYFMIEVDFRPVLLTTTLIWGCSAVDVSWILTIEKALRLGPPKWRLLCETHQVTQAAGSGVGD